MDSAVNPVALIVVVGPQASGKSTLATALSAELRKRDETVALVELDQIAAMALPTLPSWEAAHEIFEAVTGLWARTELTCVIAEGSGTQDEVLRLLSQAPPGCVAVTVVITASFEVALARAEADPTRGISKKHSFLSSVYERWSREITRINSDVLVDTGALDVDQGIERIWAAIRSARAGVR